MRFLVSFELEPSYVGGPDIVQLNETAVKFFAGVESDPRFECSGHFADGRGGFIVANVASPQELLSILGPFIMHVRFTTHPLISLAEASQFIAEISKRMAPG